MAATYKGLMDVHGRPIEKRVLTEEIAGASVGGVRSPITGYPANGMHPERLAAILKEADQGHPLRYLELAEAIEERDLHYAGVLGTRKRAVSQLEITVEAASEDAKDVEIADMVRDWLMRDELQADLFDILDATGKGVSYTEIIWDTSAGQWEPKRLEWRDPRWFRPDPANLTTPMMIGDGGALSPLQPGKFIHAVMRAKSGLPLRSGIARIAAWAWMFKAYSNRDWAIFTQTFGQPIRLGKYPSGASEKEKSTLFRAVAEIAGDCAAIIPEGMNIEFVSTGSVSASADLYEKRVNWLDQQISKGVLGQTATTDAIAGGHAVGQEHRQVQEDIERADAKALSAILNRDLIRPWVMLEYGPDVAVPRLRIGRPDQKDVKQTVEAVARLVPLGLKVSQAEMRDLIGLADVANDEEILRPETPPAPSRGNEAADLSAKPVLAEQKSAHQVIALPTSDELAEQGAALAAAAEAALIDRLAEIIAAHDTEAARLAAIETAWPSLPAEALKALLTRALVVAELMGRLNG